VSAIGLMRRRAVSTVLRMPASTSASCLLTIVSISALSISVPSIVPDALEVVVAPADLRQFGLDRLAVARMAFLRLRAPHAQAVGVEPRHRAPAVQTSAAAVALFLREVML